ncbi:alpha/beta hydrolase [Sneathiella chinensis]|uniref:Alpha/beta hydrolase fold-3 domain-containing protein n=1 Tax=Sneathiella chinensis TaxID=349750 RepID=A0ABQ5U7B5_9PROT|nr:alpha/beta hydrolase [Sneathiella chinensis]GLQ07793.1 hypothetical protein GCM10007924_30150 [Sneathiella chinensis]
MLKAIRLIAKIPYFLMMRSRLLTRSDAYWEKRVGDRAPEIDGRRLKPRAQGLIELQERLSIPSQHWTPALLRNGYDKSVEMFDGPRPEVRQVRDMDISLPGRTLAARLYDNEATGQEARPCLVYFHGGGFVIGGLESHDGLCRKLARELAHPVLAIDYRLGPENRFPAAMEDALDVWRWVQENAADLNLDPAALSVAGDSAGAALSLLVAAWASRGEVGARPRSLGLIYPPLALVHDTPSRDRLKDEKVILTGELLEWFMAHFVSEDMAEGHPYLAPLDYAVAGNLPPAWILTCGFDPLRDDGEMIRDRLRHLGARVEHTEYPDLYHGFIGASALFSEVDDMVKSLSRFMTETGESAKPGVPAPEPVE